MTNQAKTEAILAEKILAIAGVKRNTAGFGDVVLEDLSGEGYEMPPVADG